MSVRAVDEWIVRDGVVVVVGLDYSRFLGAGGADTLSPRLGIQFDANARTRLKAAYTPGDEGAGIQSSTGFEDGDVIFKQPSSRPVAFVGGRAVMEWCPLNVKREMSVWPPAGDERALAQRLKSVFDPHGILAPGRFLGGL